MTNCKYITKNGRCELKDSYAYRHGCFGEDMCKCREPMTNADRIRAMSDEELAELLLDGCRGSKCDDQSKNEWGSVNCFQCRVTWLQQPAEDD